MADFENRHHQNYTLVLIFVCFYFVQKGNITFGILLNFYCQPFFIYFYQTFNLWKNWWSVYQSGYSWNFRSAAAHRIKNWSADQWQLFMGKCGSGNSHGVFSVDDGGIENFSVDGGIHIPFFIGVLNA